jgi:hypothetical protein
MRNKIALMILMLIALVMIGCSSDERSYVENNTDTSGESTDQSGLDGLAGLVRVPVLFGVGESDLLEGQVRTKNGIGTSSLYLINPINGSAMLIGDIGYNVSGIAYDAITNKLYGIASPYVKASVKSDAVVVAEIKYGSQLIEINMATGEGTLIGDITGTSESLKGPSSSFSHPTFNSTGTLYAQALCTIDLTTAEPSTFSHTFTSYPSGLAFNNFDVLYLFYDYHGGPDLYIIDASTGDETFVRDFSDTTYNGDINPITGKYWSLDNIYVSPRNLLVMDMNTGNIESTIPTLSNLEAITFGFVDMSTLALMGLTNLSDFFIQEDPE